MTSCARFEHELAQVMGEELEEAERRERLAALRAHGRACPECAASLDLVELLALGPAERDLIEDPGPAYWDGFSRRLDRRIEAAGSGPVRSSWRPWWVAAAAVLLLAIAAWLTVRRSGPGPEAPGELAADPRLPAALVDQLVEASPEEVAAQLEVIEDWSTAWDAGGGLADGEGADHGVLWERGWFPDVDDLSAEERRELMSWLRSQASRGEHG